MNRFIETDITNGLLYIKAAIMNALYELDNGDETELSLNTYVPYLLIRDCLDSSGWISQGDYRAHGQTVDFCEHWMSPTGKIIEVSGSFLAHDNLTFYIDNDY